MVDEWEKMPDFGRKNYLVPTHKNKEDVQVCENYRCIQLKSNNTMRVWDKVIEMRLREETTCQKTNLNGTNILYETFIREV